MVFSCVKCKWAVNGSPNTTSLYHLETSEGLQSSLVPSSNISNAVATQRAFSRRIAAYQPNEHLQTTAKWSNSDTIHKRRHCLVRWADTTNNMAYPSQFDMWKCPLTSKKPPYNQHLKGRLWGKRTQWFYWTDPITFDFDINKIQGLTGRLWRTSTPLETDQARTLFSRIRAQEHRVTSFKTQANVLGHPRRKLNEVFMNLFTTSPTRLNIHSDMGTPGVRAECAQRRPYQCAKWGFSDVKISKRSITVNEEAPYLQPITREYTSITKEPFKTKQPLPDPATAPVAHAAVKVGWTLPAKGCILIRCRLSGSAMLPTARSVPEPMCGLVN